MKDSSVAICLSYSTWTDELDYIRSLVVPSPFCPHYLVFSALICLLQGDYQQWQQWQAYQQQQQQRGAADDRTLATEVPKAQCNKTKHIWKSFSTTQGPHHRP